MNTTLRTFLRRASVDKTGLVEGVIVGIVTPLNGYRMDRAQYTVMSKNVRTWLVTTFILAQLRVQDGVGPEGGRPGQYWCT